MDHSEFEDDRRKIQLPGTLLNTQAFKIVIQLTPFFPQVALEMKQKKFLANL